jgi:amidophosphoribosyltransferase
MRISAPPIKHPCHYGVDMSTREEMIAHGRTVEEIAPSSAATRSPTSRSGGVYEAIGGTRETHCDACFTGEYPAGRHRRRAREVRVRGRRAAARAGLSDRR